MLRIVWAAAIFVAMTALTVEVVAQAPVASITVYKNAD